jgi:hypothetical protein
VPSSIELSPLAAKNWTFLLTAVANTAASADRSLASQLLAADPHDQLATSTPTSRRSCVTSCMPLRALGPKVIVMSAAVPVSHHQVNATMAMSSIFSTFESWSLGSFFAPPTVRTVSSGASIPHAATSLVMSVWTTPPPSEPIPTLTGAAPANWFCLNPYAVRTCAGDSEPAGKSVCGSRLRTPRRRGWWRR